MIKNKITVDTSFIQDPSHKWWPEYNGEHLVLIDDYKSEGTGLPLDQLLRILDRYPVSGEVKGGHVNLGHRYTFITSTIGPEAIWPSYGSRNVSQINRRLAGIINVIHTEPAELIIKRILEVPNR